MIILLFFAIPVVLLSWVIGAFFKTKKVHLKNALLYFFIAYIISIALGIIGIGADRGSTAGIGYIFLPFMAFIPSILAFGLGFYYSRYKQNKKNQEKKDSLSFFMIIIFGVLLCIPYLFQITYWIEESKQNRIHSEQAQAQQEKFKKSRKIVKKALMQNLGNESTALEKLSNNITDRTMLISIAESKYASSDLLENLSHTNDLGVLNTVARNKNTSPDLLEKIYTEQAIASYFYNALASNPNTPVSILEKLYQQKVVNSGITPSLIENPSTPQFILQELSKSSEVRVFWSFVKRNDSDCATLNKMKQGVKPEQKKRRIYKFAVSDLKKICE